MAGLLIASFLCYFIGFIGPFAFMGAFCILITLLMDKLIDFHNSKEQTGNNAVLYQASIIKNSILRNNQPLKSTMNEGNKNNLENDGEI